MLRLTARWLVIFAGVAWAMGGLAWAEGPSKKDKPAGHPPAGNPPPPSVYIPSDGKARTSLFGTSGEGYKFVYVFDRSGSMGGNGARSLRAVKAELQKSLANLDTVHQFQIIFYNERPVAFNPTGTPGRLAFANEQNKRRAVEFVATITAEGGTRHDDALTMAIGMRPDVIFFLTDGDEPKLGRHQLDTIQRQAAGITINTIQFGDGPKPDEKSFLAVMAEENGGQYAYVDTTKRD